jgi:queuine tRNA-ribosyltransferase
MFDCVLPTRLGRHGTLLLPKGKINLRNSKWKTYFGPAMEDCDCPLCKNFTLAYVAHLIKAKEMFGGILCSMHYIRLLSRIIEGAREAIEENRFREYKKSILE